MAAAHCATAAFHFPSARKPPLTISSIPIQFPSKPIKRKTHFHTKIYNTPPKPELTPTIPSESPLPQQLAGTEVKESPPIEQQVPVSESESPSGEYPLDQQSPVEGLTGFEPVEAKQPSEQFPSKKTIKFPPIEQKRRIDIYRFLREKIEEQSREANEFSYSESISSPQIVYENEFAGNNNFATPSALQLGLSFVAAIVLDVVWSISMNKKLKRIAKAKEGKLGTEKDEKRNTSVWERWAEHKRKRVEAKNKGDVVVDESAVDKKVVEIQELAKEAREEEKLGAKGNESNADDHVVESEVKKEG